MKSESDQKNNIERKKLLTGLQYCKSVDKGLMAYER